MLLEIPKVCRTVLRLSTEAARGLDKEGFSEIAREIDEWVSLEGHLFAQQYPEWDWTTITTSEESSKAFDLIQDISSKYLPEARDSLFEMLDKNRLIRPKSAAEWGEAVWFLKVEATRGGLIGDEKWSDMVFMQPSSSVKEQPASISLGSFVAFDSSIGGSASLDLGENFASIIGSSEDENSSVSLNQPLVIGDGRYNVSELIVDRESPRNNFIIVIVPENDAAKKRELAMGSSVVRLTDNIPQQYKWMGTRTSWSENEDSIEWQQLSFDGFPSPNANQLDLEIQGVGALAGPIVFHNITLP